MARKRKRSLIEKAAIIGVLALAIFGGYKLYQENSQAVNKKVAEVETVANKIYVALTDKVDLERE